MQQPSTRRKVMVIGLDGLTLKILLPLVAAGELPTFARLLRAGAYGELRSITNMTTGPTWASFATGCGPERHGILHDFHYLPDSAVGIAQRRHRGMWLYRRSQHGECS